MAMSAIYQFLVHSTGILHENVLGTVLIWRAVFLELRVES